MSEPQIFNPHLLDEIIEIQNSGEPGLLDQLFDDYKTKQIELCARIADSIASKNYKELEMAAHSLKSSSFLLGFEKIAKSCSLLEESARDKKPLEKIQNNLPEQINEALAAFNQYRSPQ